jgi:hypothetical protein
MRHFFNMKMSVASRKARLGRPPATVVRRQSFIALAKVKSVFQHAPVAVAAKPLCL